MIYLTFLQAATRSPLDQLIGALPLIAIAFVFYFMFFRPQQKKMKDHKTFQASLNKGDLVATSSGIIGKINKLEDGIVTLQLDQKTFIKITQESLSKEISEAIRDKNVIIG